jgi:very-short-patch-repair endonuclease
VRVIASRARRAHLACAVPRAAYLEATCQEAGNAWTLLKLAFVDKPSTPRERARRLRREQTEAERFLWSRLRARQLSGAKFRRQCPIGPFIADFCCLEGHLIIELDGGQHASEVEKDEARSDFLRKQGYEVLRFWDHEVFLETEVVLQMIADLLAARDSKKKI